MSCPCSRLTAAQALAAYALLSCTTAPGSPRLAEAVHAYYVAAAERDAEHREDPPNGLVQG